MKAMIKILEIVMARPSFFTSLVADLALLLVLVVSLALLARRKGRKKGPGDEEIPCGECHRLIPPDRFNCIFCGWPHVQERTDQSSSDSWK